jgi:hypothetical protein
MNWLDHLRRDKNLFARASRAHRTLMSDKFVWLAEIWKILPSGMPRV